MGSSKSTHIQHVFINRLKSALQLQKGERLNVFNGISSITQNYNIFKHGHYKSLGTNTNVDYSTYDIIGRGSFGIVYAGRNEHSEPLAIKRRKHLSDAELMEKSGLLFKDELEALYNLNHTNIVKLIGIEFDKNEPIGLVMEYIAGEPLDKYIRMYRSLSEPIIQSFTKQIIDAVAYMHSRFVMHRDIKSSNVMIVANTYVKLIDFGMAKHFDVNDNAVTSNDVSTSTVVGTVPYMAPELINFNKYNSKVDIWSIGVIIYEMSTGDVFIRIPRVGGVGVDTIALQYAPFVQSPMLSQIANNFMQYCLTKNADYRPSASNLLHHPFIQNFANPSLFVSQNSPPIQPQHSLTYQYYTPMPILSY